MATINFVPINDQQVNFHKFHMTRHAHYLESN